MQVLNSLSYLLLGTNASLGRCVIAALGIAGLWGIFRKCGVEGWWALVPVARTYKLSVCAGREPEGRTLSVVDGLMIPINIAVGFLDTESNLTLFLGIAEILLGLIYLIYNIRVYLGLIEVFGVKKCWILLCMATDWIPNMIWGWLSVYQPRWTVQEIQSEAANFFSGAHISAMENGLTVNLEERTATEFFKKKYLLRDIHMYIKPGHMVLLLGGSGAGKTTYLNAVNGYEKAKAEVVLNGRNMYRNYKEMQYEIGFVPQADLMRGSDSVLRTLLDAASLRLSQDFSAADRRNRVEEVMKIFGLTPVQNNLVDKLSGGQRKRLSIAMEFISNPSLFILDEPDSGLDGVMARELFEQLRHIADQGKIIIVITHTPDRVIDLFDDVIVLAKDAKRTGRLAFFGPIEEARAFFGKDRMEEIVKSINREEEGGEGRADEFILKYAEVQHG
ncbi:MAG: ATP-binding cassette domain-containing protein [Clostridia bacterium]|nr:ATP-binding cassette domain-containing protein [Clostridia bacterium]